MYIKLPYSYYNAWLMYGHQALTEYSWMCYLTRERQSIPPRARKVWNKWKAFYFQGTELNEQEMRIRLILAKRIESIKEMDKEYL